MSAAATPLKSAILWGSCCLKTTLVVFEQHDFQIVSDLNGVDGDPLIAPETLKTQKNYVFGGSSVENGFPSTIRGSNVTEIFIFLISNKNYPLFVKKKFSISSPEKVIVLPNFLQKL